MREVKNRGVRVGPTQQARQRIQVVVLDQKRPGSASGGSETQQNHATLARLASGVSMLTRPPVAVRVTHAPSSQTKSLGPRLATMTMPARAVATPYDGSRIEWPRAKRAYNLGTLD